MTDLTAEQRADLRAKAEAHKDAGGIQSKIDTEDLLALLAEIDRLREEKDNAYAERNKVVLALAKHYPCRWGIDADEPEWRVLFIELPTGQVSWHFSLAEYEAARGLNVLAHNGVWDGHTTEEKYRRLAALQEGKPAL